MPKNFASSNPNENTSPEDLKMSLEKRERLKQSGAVANEGPSEPEYANESVTDSDTKIVET